MEGELYRDIIISELCKITWQKQFQYPLYVWWKPWLGVTVYEVFNIVIHVAYISNSYDLNVMQVLKTF